MKVAHKWHVDDIPRLDGLQRAHEHLVQSQSVGPKLLHHVIGVDDVATTLGHLLPVRACHVRQSKSIKIVKYR